MSAPLIQIRPAEVSILPLLVKDLRYLAIAGYPFEVCGVIHQHGIIHQYANTFCGDKRHGFDMEVDIEDKSIIAIWHSHPNGLAEPSKDDLPCMQLMATHGLAFPWIIVTSKSVTSWECLLT